MTIIIEEHIEKLVDSFVLKNRRERWHFLFKRNDIKTYHNSHKLFNDLSPDYRKRDDELKTIVNLDVQGFIYDIGREKPRIGNLKQMLKEYTCFDAIFSIIPGKLAIFFFHEGEIFVLRKSV